MPHYSAEQDAFERELGESLARLPTLEPPVGGWMELQRRMHARRRKLRTSAFGGFALAACLVLAVGVPNLMLAPEAIIVQPPQLSETARLMQRSSVLEQQLASARPRVRRWNGAQSLQVAQLEQGLSLIDYQINVAEPDEARKLWKDRVQLMAALVKLHEQPAPVLVQAAYQY